MKSDKEVPWCADYVNYLASGKIHPDYDHQLIKKIYFIFLIKSSTTFGRILFYTKCADKVVGRCARKNK